jgi:hypothetical protein
MSDAAIQQQVKDLYSSINESFGQAMESEKLEAKFKKMKKKDIIKLRIALTLILPSLLELSDDANSEISH